MHMTYFGTLPGDVYTISIAHYLLQKHDLLVIDRLALGVGVVGVLDQRGVVCHINITAILITSSAHLKLVRGGSSGVIAGSVPPAHSRKKAAHSGAALAV